MKEDHCGGHDKQKSSYNLGIINRFFHPNKKTGLVCFMEHLSFQVYLMPNPVILIRIRKVDLHENQKCKHQFGLCNN